MGVVIGCFISEGLWVFVGIINVVKVVYCYIFLIIDYVYGLYLIGLFY